MDRIVWRTSAIATLFLVASVAACGEQATSPEGQIALSQAETGNGAPSGPHFNLNVIGVDKGHDKEMSPNGRHTIFVKLWGKCDIGLTEGDYQVLDWSCLDGDRAEFQLPNPADADANGKLEYSVFARAVTPGQATIQTCFTDGSGTFCNIGDLIVPLSKNGKPRFTNVSKELLQVCADPEGDGSFDRSFDLFPLFSDPLADYFWHYDNKGLRLAQFRFYELQTTNQGGDCTGKQGGHPTH
jgi:hypothetical protein